MWLLSDKNYSGKFPKFLFLTTLASVIYHVILITNIFVNGYQKWDAPIKEENYVLDRGREIAWKMANRARTACIEKYSALCDTQV